MPLYFSIKPLTKSGVTYAAGQFVIASKADGDAAVTAGSLIHTPFNPMLAPVNRKAAAVAAPASANFLFAFSRSKGSATTTTATLAAITASVTDPLKQITVAGGPARLAGSITVTYSIDGATDKTVTAAVAKNDTAAVAAGAVVAANKDADLLLTSGAAGVINVAAAATKAVTKLSVSVTGTTR